MRSLRVRLVLAFALVAIVPLAIALALWTRTIQRTVRNEAEQRLAIGLRQARGAIESEGRGVETGIGLLARDAQLRRLLLVDADNRAELGEYLATQQQLLGLDYLWIEQLDGVRIADGANVPGRLSASGRALLGALDRADTVGLRVAPVRPPAAPGDLRMALDVIEPIEYLGRREAMLRGGRVLAPDLLLRLGAPNDLRLATFDPANRIASRNFERSDPAGDPGPGIPVPPQDAIRHVALGGTSYWCRAVPLAIGPPPSWTLAGYFPTTGADAAIRALRLGAAGLGALALAVAIALGLLFSLQLSRPVERLAAFSDRIARGDWDEPLREGGVRELRTLVASLERMRGDLAATRERLAAGERQAAYGQMARKVAHEIKNPLTPIAISIADLKRSFDQRRPEFPDILDQAVRTIGDEVDRLQQLIREFSELGRFPAPHPDWLDLREVGRDLATLYGHEVSAGRLAIEGFGTDPGDAPRLRADRAQLRQVLVNLLQNGLDAAGANGHVTLSARQDGDHVEIVVRDDGPGLSPDQRAHLFVPGFTTKREGSGLGLTIVERIVTDHGGTITVDTSPAGTSFRIRLPRNPGA